MLQAVTCWSSRARFPAVGILRDGKKREGTKSSTAEGPGQICTAAFEQLMRRAPLVGDPRCLITIPTHLRVRRRHTTSHVCTSLGDALLLEGRGGGYMLCKELRRCVRVCVCVHVSAYRSAGFSNEHSVTDNKCECQK